MDLTIGSAVGSSDEQEAADTRQEKKSYHRHTSQQIERLESFFSECPHPDDRQRRQLGVELGLEPKQIKFWFQNKRTQTKTQSERADNTLLRAENGRILCENVAIREALRNVICPACGGPPFGEEERQRSQQKLLQENAQLKEEHEKVSNLLAKYIGKPISPIGSLTTVPRSSSLGLLAGTSLNKRLGSPPDLCLGSSSATWNNTASYQTKSIPSTERALMFETAASAMDELITLIRMDEPLWIKFQADGRYVLHRESYDKLYPKEYHFKNASTRIESSKDSGMVTMTGMHLAEMITDSDKRLDLFPTIVTKSRTIEVLEAGMLENHNGSLQLMYEQMHILSPMVPPREFYFLRLCQKIELGTWVVVDVSYEFPKEDTSPSRSWRLPSGCMIQEMPNGCSKVTWIEHVEVDDKSQTHRLYRDLVYNTTAYGAERWVATLRRMCERMAFSMGETRPCRELGGVFAFPEGRRSIVNLSHRMVKNFCGILSMSGKVDFSQLSEVNNSGFRVAVRNSTEPGQPRGMIVSAATSLWLPLPPQNVFNFFRDEKTRIQWDVLSNGNPVHEIAHISTGAHLGNCISVMRPSVPNENIFLLQESCVDTLGSLVVYAPVDMPSIHIAMSGEDSSYVPILPSGFVISGDGRPKIGAGPSTSISTGRSGGSLLTVAFQILVSGLTCSPQLSVESVATVNTLISSTVQRIKAALNCSGLD